MILHIAFPEKFFNDYIDFVNDNFEVDRHTFFFLKKGKNSKTAPNVVFSRYYRFGVLFYIELLIYMLKADKVVLHSLSKWSVIRFLFFFPWLARKCYWYLWGADLYYNIVEKGSLKYYYFRNIAYRKVVRNLGCIVSNRGDYQIVKDEFNTQAEHLESFLYPSNLFKNIDISAPVKDEIWIQVGNSADPSNNHIEAIDWIKTLNLPRYKVVCPLSYGNAKHAELVKQYGQEQLGESFIPLTTFMNLDEYVKLLSKIDVAIFNHKRQQAVGNIVTLLGFGKSVYIREDVTTTELLERVGVKLFPIGRDGITSIELLTPDEKERNIAKIKEFFSKEMLILQSKKIFGD